MPQWTEDYNHRTSVTVSSNSRITSSTKTEIPPRVKGTCQWFLSHPRYLKWLEPGSSLLWVSADPGCGKSVLSKSIIDNELQKTSTRTTCYFFFKDDSEDQRSATKAVCALLHQIFVHKPGLLKHAEREYYANGAKLVEEPQNLWEILVAVAANPDAGEIICIIDALDECEEEGRKWLISALCTFYEHELANKTSHLKFLLTGRPYWKIETKFSDLETEFPTIRLTGEAEQEMNAISEEIELVLDANVKKIVRDFHLETAEDVSFREKLSKMKNRTYIWLYLVFDLIQRDLDSPIGSNRKTILDDIPGSVDAAYTSILSKSSWPDLARKLLSIICAAVRPLSVKETITALQIEPTHKKNR